MRRLSPGATVALVDLTAYENKNLPPSVVPTSSAAVGSGFTLGLNLGDRSHYVYVLAATGQARRSY